MLSAKLRLILRVGALAGLVGLLVFVSGIRNEEYAQAAPVVQETPGYNAPTSDGQDTNQGYGAPGTETPGVDFSPTAEATITQTSTLAPDVFRTEDAEMNNALVTPLATGSIAPTITPYQTPTGTKTQLTTVTPAAAKKKGGFSPNWGMFWIGFSLPVLGACGVVLYLLDRRPDLFKPR